jgi:hypothetical protein
MTRHKSFETAAARRRLDPIVWEIDGTEIQLRASVDLAAVGVLVDSLQDQPDDDGTGMSVVMAKRSRLLAAMRGFILDDSQSVFDELEPDLDFWVLVDMHNELIAEYAGSGNPTKRASSSVGSEPTGEISTDGAAPEDSTPLDSPSIEP